LQRAGQRPKGCRRMPWRTGNPCASEAQRGRGRARASGWCRQQKARRLLPRALRKGTVGLSPVIANGLDGAAFFGFFAAGFFLRQLRLLGKVRVTTVFVAHKIVGRSFTAQVAVNALIINIVLARHVFRILVCNVSHKSSCIGAAIWLPSSVMASAFGVFVTPPAKAVAPRVRRSAAAPQYFLVNFLRDASSVGAAADAALAAVGSGAGAAPLGGESWLGGDSV